MIVRSLAAHEVGAMAPELVRIQHAAYAIEAALIGDDRIPPLHETQAELERAQLQWIAALEHDAIAGSIAFDVREGIVDIDRLTVDPARHRRGIAVRLVRAALDHGVGATVSTGRDNLPARRLYERLDFVHDRDVEVLDGLWVSGYVRRAPS